MTWNVLLESIIVDIAVESPFTPTKFTDENKEFPKCKFAYAVIELSIRAPHPSARPPIYVCYTACTYIKWCVYYLCKFTKLDTQSYILYVPIANDSKSPLSSP